MQEPVDGKKTPQGSREDIRQDNRDEVQKENELEFSNRVAGNLEHRSGMLAAILGEDDDAEPDEPVSGNVVDFPAGRRRK